MHKAMTDLYSLYKMHLISHSFVLVSESSDSTEKVQRLSRILLTFMGM
jgi:hypothetical protein